MLGRPQQPVYGGMATMTTRSRTLPAAVASVLPQVDRLYIYLDGFSDVPAYLKGSEKVVCIKSAAVPGLHASGKFLPLTEARESFIFAGFDDDIEYGPGYISNLRGCLNNCGHQAVIGAHGIILPAEINRYTKGRTVYHFADRLQDEKIVDIVGTGTAMLSTDTLRFDPRAWEHVNSCDLHLAIEAARRRIPLVCNARPAELLAALDENQEDSLFSAITKDDSTETRMARDLLAVMKARRPTLALPSLVPLRIAIARAKRRIVGKQQSYQGQAAPHEAQIAGNRASEN